MKTIKIPTGVDVEGGVMIAPRISILGCGCGCGNVHISFRGDDGRVFACAMLDAAASASIRNDWNRAWAESEARRRWTHEEIALARAIPVGEA